MTASLDTSYRPENLGCHTMLKFGPTLKVQRRETKMEMRFPVSVTALGFQLG